MTKTLRRSAAAGALLMVSALALPAAATATPVAGPSVVSVTANRDALVAPGIGHLRPGAATFRVTTPDTATRLLGLAELRPGVRIEDFLANMALALYSPDPAEQEAAGIAAQQQADLLGGVIVDAQTPLTFTQVLRPGGRYYLSDYRALETGTGAAHVHRINVSGPVQWGHPLADHVVLAVEDAAGTPTFRAPQQIGARSRVLYANLTTQIIQEMNFLRVAPGFTDEDVNRFFAGAGPWPFTGASIGLMPVSVDRSAMLHVNLPPGRYVMISWMSAESMHQLVTLH